MVFSRADGFCEYCLAAKPASSTWATACIVSCARTACIRKSLSASTLRHYFRLMLTPSFISVRIVGLDWKYSYGR